MRVHQNTIEVRTRKMNDFIKVTDGIQRVLDESGITNGILFANSVHTTAALIIQENDSTVFEDMINFFEKILPSNGKYNHMDEGPANAVAHQKQNLLGNSVNIPVTDGKLILGTWQDIFLLEFFEARARKIVITVIGD